MHRNTEEKNVCKNMRSIFRLIESDEVRKVYIFTEKKNRRTTFVKQKKVVYLCIKVFDAKYIVYRLAGVECGEQLNHA